MFVSGPAPFGGGGQIERELDYFLHQYTLHPKVYLAYDRLAYMGIEDEELRITFDSHIRTREEELYLGEGDEGRELLPEGQVLMELKIPGVMPMWLARLLSQLGIYPTSFSKYGTYFQQRMIMKQRARAFESLMARQGWQRKISSWACGAMP